MSVLRRMAFCLFYAAVFAVPTSAQDSQLFRSLDSLGLDPALFLETGYFTNTRDGFSVVQGQDQRWYYARLNEFGNVVPTDMPVGVLGKQSPDELAFLPRAARHLETEPAIRDRLERMAEAQEGAIDRSRIQSTQKGFASGSRDILVLGIEFPDLRAPFGIGYLDSLMNINTLDPKTGRGGFKDYYIENSYGKFVPNSHVYGWFEAEHPLSFYTDTLSGEVAAGRLAEEALGQADLAGVDFRLFDFDGDRHADPVVIVTTAPSSRIRARFSELVGRVKFSNMYFGSYSLQDVHLGNLVHEYGHALGLHDMYQPPHSFGCYDVMGLSAFAISPGHFSAYSKILLGWIDPLVIEEPTEGLLVPNSHDNPFAVVIPGRNGTEWSHFVIENRVQKGYDSGRYGTISDSGLMIYHVHDREGSWTHVEQADGRQDLEAYAASSGVEGNLGDAGDFFPGTTHNTRFDKRTNPSSRTDDAVDTGIIVSLVSPPRDTMKIDVDLTELPTEIVEITAHRIHASALEGALLGPETDRHVRVYLPELYLEYPEARFPVVYLLHGGQDSFNFINAIGGKPMFDSFFQTEGTQPMIIVIPDSYQDWQTDTYRIPSTAEWLLYRSGWWVNSYAVGNWQDYLLEDVIPYIDSTFRTIAEPTSRGIAGLDPGGYGAIRMAMEHPDVFQVVMGLNATELDFEFSALYIYRMLINRLGANPRPFEDLDDSTTIAAAACLTFAPDSTATPLMCSVPVDSNGVVIDSLWARWLEHDPVRLITNPEYRENLMGLEGFGLESGGPYYAEVNTRFHQALTNQGIEHDTFRARGLLVTDLPERFSMTMLPFFSEKLVGQGIFVGSEDPELPNGFRLHQNYPNPFNPTTTIRYDLSSPTDVRLIVFDPLGRVIESLGSWHVAPGTHAVTFDATGYSSGIYFYRLEAGDHVEARSLIVAK